MTIITVLSLLFAGNTKRVNKKNFFLLLFLWFILSIKILFRYPWENFFIVLFVGTWGYLLHCFLRNIHALTKFYLFFLNINYFYVLYEILSVYFLNLPNAKSNFYTRPVGFPPFLEPFLSESRSLFIFENERYSFFAIDAGQSFYLPQSLSFMPQTASTIAILYFLYKISQLEDQSFFKKWFFVFLSVFSSICTITTTSIVSLIMTFFAKVIAVLKIKKKYFAILLGSFFVITGIFIIKNFLLIYSLTGKPVHDSLIEEVKQIYGSQFLSYLHSYPKSIVFGSAEMDKIKVEIFPLMLFAETGIFVFLLIALICGKPIFMSLKERNKKSLFFSLIFLILSSSHYPVFSYNSLLPLSCSLLALCFFKMENKRLN